MPWILDACYGLAALAVGPFFWLWRVFNAKPLAPLADRLYRFPSFSDERPLIWIHGVSVGEILAARSLVVALRSRYPDRRLVLSYTTPTARAVAHQHYPDLVSFYCPLDFGFAVRRAVRALSPQILVLMELDLWPNLLRQLKREQIPVLVANGKISPKSQAGYGRLLKIMPGFLAGIRRFCVQNEEYARRFRALGVEEERIDVTGSLKVDNLPPALDSMASTTACKALGVDSKVRLFLAGSTHPGEDEAVFDAYLAVFKKFPNLRCVLAPRHLERLSAIEVLARSKGLRTRRLSLVREADDDNEVVLVDSMGDLPSFYAAADVVFLGGSLSRTGGHNVLEPAACGVPQILGPHTWTVSELSQALAQAGGAFVVEDARELGLTLSRLLGDEEARCQAGRAARLVVDEHRGATKRTMAALEKLIPSGRQ